MATTDSSPRTRYSAQARQAFATSALADETSSSPVSGNEDTGRQASFLLATPWGISMSLKKCLLSVVFLVAGGLAQAHSYEAGAIHIDHPWSRAMPPTAPAAAAYFVLQNTGAEADRLLGASTPVAGKAELHEHAHVDGLMKMHHVPVVDIGPGEQVDFVPGGYHVMLFELSRQMQAGERFPLTLRFEKAGEVTVEVAVQADAPQSAPAQHGMMHHAH